MLFELCIFITDINTHSYVYILKNVCMYIYLYFIFYKEYFIYKSNIFSIIYMHVCIYIYIIYSTHNVNKLILHAINRFAAL